MGVPKEAAISTDWFAGAIGLLVGLIWGLVVVRMALKKQYGDFRVALIPKDSK